MSITSWQKWDLSDIKIFSSDEKFQIAKRSSISIFLDKIVFLKISRFWESQVGASKFEEPI